MIELIPVNMSLLGNALPSLVGVLLRDTASLIWPLWLAIN